MPFIKLIFCLSFLTSILQVQAQVFNANLSSFCETAFVQELYSVQAYSKNGYWVQMPTIDSLFSSIDPKIHVDSSRHIIQTLDCLEQNNLAQNYYQAYSLNLICFYSKNQYSALYQKRNDLLVQYIMEKDISVLFILQEFPDKVYFDKLADHE
ncbi:MAG: hypothetical protein WED33_03930 [Bacteroidia bacterium]